MSSAPAGLSKDDDAGRFHGTKKGNFHEIFNLTENERPLAGLCGPWAGGGGAGRLPAQHPGEGPCAASGCPAAVPPGLAEHSPAALVLLATP